MTWSRGGICTDPPAGHGQRPANTWRGAKSNGRESDCVCMKEGTGGGRGTGGGIGISFGFKRTVVFGSYSIIQSF